MRKRSDRIVSRSLTIALLGVGLIASMASAQRGTTTYYCTTSVSGANGTIAPNGIVSMAYNATTYISLTPASGYEVGTITLNGANLTIAKDGETLSRDGGTVVLGKRYIYFYYPAKNYKLAVTFVSATDDYVLVNNTNSSITYNGSWSSSSGSGSFNNDYRYTTVSGDVVSYTFTGSDLDLIGPYNYNAGDIILFFDNEPQVPVGCNPGNLNQLTHPTEPQQVLHRIRGSAYGSHTIKLQNRTTNNETVFFDYFKIYRQTAYNGPHNITNGATLQVENFDKGGEGIAYHDNDAANNGGQYRTNQGVDLETCSAGGYNIGYTNAGEWMEYTSNVTAGTYTVKLYMASPNTGTTTAKLYQNGALKATFNNTGSTGGWQSWREITVTNVALSGGAASILKLEEATGGFNIDKITFTASGNTQTVYNGPHNITSGATLQVEDFDNGGEGVAYHDNDASNNGGAYRTNYGVDIQTCPGGYNIGWTNTGEWLEYTCNVTSGIYFISLKVASPNSGTQLKLYQDNTLRATFTVPNTGNWQTYTEIVEKVISLSAGSASVLKLEAIGGFNFDYLTFTITREENESTPVLNEQIASPNASVQEYDVKIFSLSGKQVASFKTRTACLDIGKLGSAMPRLNKGNYIYSATTKGGRSVSKRLLVTK